MKVYVLIHVMYDWYRFDNFKGVYKSESDARNKATEDRRNVDVVVSTINNYASGKLDDNEVEHYWICECEV